MGSMIVGVIVSARFIIYSYIIHICFWSYSKFLCVVIHLSSLRLFQFIYSTTRYISLCCHQSPKRERLYASRPLRYVSVIYDNHLVALMNFNEAKEN
jgi:hypothetical protein